MRCTSPVRLRHLSPSIYPDGLLVPCGKCLACRIAKRTEWAMRMLHELSDYEDAVFVTLTYDEDHIPSNHSLKKVTYKNGLNVYERRLSRKNKVLCVW